MNIEVSLKTYKALVLQLLDESDTFDNVIDRMIPRCVSQESCVSALVRTGEHGFAYKGHWHSCTSAIDVYLQSLARLSEDYSKFFELFEERCRYISGARPYVARDKEFLYPGRPELQRYARRIGDWWLDGNWSNKQKGNLLRSAIDVIGLRCPTDYQFSFPKDGDLHA